MQYIQCIRKTDFKL